MMTETSYTTVCDSTDRPRWLAERRTGIGASEAAVLVGEHAWLDLARLVAIKRGLLEEPEGVERLEWGLRHERTIREAYASPRYAGRETRPAGQLIRSIAHPWALATLDAWTRHPTHSWIPLEEKAIEIWKADEWTYGPPPTYWWQCQMQALVTGAPCVSITALLGVHRLVWCDVDRDEAAIRRLAMRGPEVWSLVESGEDPPAPYDEQTFRALYPREEPGSVIELGEDALALDAEREDLAETIRRSCSRRDAIDDELRARMRRAERARLPSGVTYSLREQRRAAYTAPETTMRVLRRHAPKERKTKP